MRSENRLSCTISEDPRWGPCPTPTQKPAYLTKPLRFPPSVDPCGPHVLDTPAGRRGSAGAQATHSPGISSDTWKLHKYTCNPVFVQHQTPQVDQYYTPARVWPPDRPRNYVWQARLNCLTNLLAHLVLQGPGQYNPVNRLDSDARGSTQNV